VAHQAVALERHPQVSDYPVLAAAMSSPGSARCFAPLVVPWPAQTVVVAVGAEGLGEELRSFGPEDDGDSVVVAVGASLVEPVAASGTDSSAEGLRVQLGLGRGGKGSGAQSTIVV
jgi:hypothetical protein